MKKILAAVLFVAFVYVMPAQVSAEEPTTTLIEINKATEADLAKVKGLGKKKIAAIMALKKELGTIERLDQLDQAKGIGKKLIDKLACSLYAEKEGKKPCNAPAAVAAKPITDADKVNLNTADAKGLQKVKGLGKAKAAAIIEYRTKNGPFKSVDELDKVKGFGPKTIENMRPYFVL